MRIESLHRLQHLCDTIPALLTAIPEGDFKSRPRPEAWSKKEILGHLIDSATNNHQRFVRGQFEHIPSISYDTDKWNAHSHYNFIDSKQLIQFWMMYNLHLIEVIKFMPKEHLARECNTGGEKNHTLEWLFDDYVVHLEHHLHQIVEYN